MTRQPTPKRSEQWASSRNRATPPTCWTRSQQRYVRTRVPQIARSGRGPDEPGDRHSDTDDLQPEAVELCFDRRVALARHRFQAGAVADRHAGMRVADQPGVLK